MDRCTGRCDITEILLKTALNFIHHTIIERERERKKNDTLLSTCKRNLGKHEYLSPRYNRRKCRKRHYNQYLLNDKNNGFVQIQSIRPFPKRQSLDSSKLIEFADDNLKSDKNGREFSKTVKNTVKKGGSARHEQFLLFSLCFKRLVLQTRKTRACLEKG